MNALPGLWIGTSGFSYDDWKGVVYPEKTPKTQWFDYYVTLFNTLELNASFYAFPSEKTIASLCRRAPQPFLFTVKAHRSITHEGQIDGLPVFFNALKSFDAKGFLPLALFQFPFSFRPYRDQVAYLRSCVEGCPYPYCVEFWNQEWARPSSVEALEKLQIPLVSVDEPELKGLMPRRAFSKDILYIRFHGRNAQKWWNHQEAYERYDYDYKPAELEEWIYPLLESQAPVKVVYFNNHFRGQAVRNAKLFAEQLEKEKAQGNHP